MCLAQGHNTVTPSRLEPAAPRSRVSLLKSPSFDAKKMKWFTVVRKPVWGVCEELTLYPIETPFSAFANRANPDQAALVRAA